MNRRMIRGAAALAAALIALVALGGCSSLGQNTPQPTNLPAETTETQVFFSTGTTLVKESRIVDANNAPAATMAELIKAAPVYNQAIAIVQPNAKVLSVTVKNGTANVDWSADVLKFKASDREKVLAWASVLYTLGQFPDIKHVTFSVEGKTAGTAGGKDIQTFWGKISLKNQPWSPMHMPAKSGEASGSATASATTK